MSDTRSPSVVVGIDGSRTALTAALWAADEAVARDVPLRLVYAIEMHFAPMTSEQSEHALLTAESAVRHVFTAIEATDKPVKIEVEILQGRPIEKLLEASRGATMMCVERSGPSTPPRVASDPPQLPSRAGRTAR